MNIEGRWSAPSGVRRGVLTVLSGAVLSQLVTLAALPILSRLYGPEAFGKFALFVSITALTAVVVTCRYEMAVVLPRSTREAVALKRMGTKIVLLLSGVITIICLGISMFWPDVEADWRWVIGLIGPGTLLIGINTFQLQWFTRLGTFYIISTNRIVMSVTTAVIQFMLGFLGYGTGTGLIFGLLTGQLLATLILYLADTSRGVGHLRERDWRYLLRRHWRFPLLNAPHALIDSFRVNSINFVIGTFSVEGLGQYSQAKRLVQMPVGLIGSSLSQVFFPKLASANKHELYPIVKRSVSRSFLAGLIPFGLLYFLSPTVLPWVLGGEWTEAGDYAQAIVPWMYMVLVASPVSTVFIVLNKQLIGLFLSGIAAVAPFMAIPVFGASIVAGVWVVSLSQAVLIGINIVLILWLTRKASRP